MKARKLAIGIMIVVFALNFSSIRAFAAEAQGTSKTEDASAETNIYSENVGTTENTAVTDSSLTSPDTTAEDTVTSGEDAAAEDNLASEDSEVTEDSAVSEDNVTEEKASEEEAADSKEVNKTAEEVNYTEAELRLLSALIFCEAQGESYNGKLAVGIIVMNRKNSSNYPDTVKGVIYQKYQFSPASSGSLKKALAEYDNGKFTSASEKECIKAAKAALNGTTTITVSGKKKDMSKYLYFSGRLKGYTFKLGNHQFK